MTLQEIVNEVEANMKAIDALIKQAEGMTDQMTHQQLTGFRKIMTIQIKAHREIAKTIHEDGGEIQPTGGAT